MNRKDMTDKSVNSYAEENANLATGGSVTIHGSVRDWVIGTILALSLVGNALSFHAWSRKEQAEDLKRYDLDFFTRNEYSPLKAQVIAHETLINSLLLKGCKREK